MEEERIFDTIIITPIGEKSADGYMMAICGGFNNDNVDDIHGLGLIGCFSCDEFCQFDFYKDGKSIAVFNKRNGKRKVYMPNSFTGRFYGV